MTTDLNDLTPRSLPEILDEDEPIYNWLVPGLLEYGDRLILTGGEGSGKSTLLRQMGIQIASGIHPFTLEEITPRRVLQIDLENPPKAVRREYQKILDNIGNVPPPDTLRITRYPQGIDLSIEVFRDALLVILKMFKPELVIIGPKYKMGYDVVKEEESKKLAQLLDMWRVVYDFALIIEDHQPHWVNTQASDGGKFGFRPERPFGSSMWMRWPEFGLCLEKDGTLRPWRGFRDSEREWPGKLLRGDDWMWLVDNRRCIVCASPLNLRQEKYCSEKCGNTARVRKFRAKEGIQEPLRYA